ncbi:hypothetical protein AHAS_Ahas16G0270600 [Arachis hypogaea]
MIKCPCPKCGFQIMQTRERMHTTICCYDHFSLDILFSCVMVRSRLKRDLNWNE